MALTPSTMLPLGTIAPDFALPDTEGRRVSLSDFEGSQGYLVMFICNHCPYVKHIREELAKITAQYDKKKLAVIAINSNDADSHPEDSPQKMKIEKEKYHYSFPYLYDETQEVAKKYQAACTPDFFLFDSNQKLVYRGQMDDSRPGNGIAVTGKDLTLAVEAILAGKLPNSEQKPSVGCNIKWK